VEDWVTLLEDCKRTLFPDHTDATPHIGVHVKPPDINLSDVDFAVVFDPDEQRDNLHGHVRFGLSAIKGIGKGAMQEIVAERRKNGPFRSIYDFCERVSSRTLNKASMEALIKCGAFDSVHGVKGRAGMLATLDEAIAAGQTAAEDARAGQMNFFGGAAEFTPVATAERSLPSVPWLDERTMLAFEKDVLGFHISGHPLDQHQATIRLFCTASVSAVASLDHDATVIIGGVLSSVRPTFVRNGKSAGEKMAMLTLQDKTGVIDGVVFSSVFAKCGAAVQNDAIVLIVGRVDKQRGEPQIIADQVMPVADASKRLTGRIEIDLREDRGDAPLESRLQMVAGFIQQAGASSAASTAQGFRAADVHVHVHAAGQRYTLKCLRARAVADDRLLQNLAEAAGGEERVRLISAGIPRRAENPAGQRWRKPAMAEV
jgi:DNA polymerase-3 subunit alpha